MKKILFSIKVFLIVSVVFTSAFSQNQNHDTSRLMSDSAILTPNQIVNILMDSLNTHVSKERYEINNDNSFLKVDDFFNDHSFFAFIFVKDFACVFFKLIENHWKELLVIDSVKDYMGYEIKDLNGDHCPDFLLTDFYIYSNKSYKVLLFDCYSKTLKYNPSFEGIFNPFYDDSTKLLNSFLFTNHGEAVKETYKFNGDSLDLVEKVTLDGIGVEDRENNTFVIKHYKTRNNSLEMLKSISLRNFTEATKTYDHLLFNYFVKNNRKQKLSCSEGWIQMR